MKDYKDYCKKLTNDVMELQCSILELTLAMQNLFQVAVLEGMQLNRCAGCGFDGHIRKSHEKHCAVFKAQELLKKMENK